MKNLINILFVQLLFLMTQVVYSQTYDDFYYTLKGKEYLNIVQNQYVVEFINGVDEDIFLQNNIEFEKLSPNIYKISTNFSFIQNNLSQVHFNPVYKRIKYGTDSFMKNEIILKFNESIQESLKDSLIANYGLIETKATSLYNQYRVTNPLQVSKAIYETGLVKYCIPVFFGSPPLQFDGYIPNDEYFNKQFYLRNTGQELNDGVYGTAGADIKATKAWEITKGNENIIIAIIDDGVMDNHIDLPTNNQIRLPGSNIFYEWDPYNDDPDDPSPVWVNEPSTKILEYHGHMVTGVAAARQDNEEGISGVAPNCKAMIVRVIFAKRNDVKHPDAIYGDAINFAYENGANVIIMAWGWSPQQPCEAETVIREAIETAINGGCIVVNAAGNFIPEKSLDVSFPASAGIEGLIVVGASDQDDIKANYSFTSEHINVVAPAGALQVWTMDFPGGNGFNPWPFGDNTTTPPYGEVLPNEGDYKLDFTGRFSGTSAATPQVAGCAALALSVNPNLSVKQMNNLVKHRADKVGPYNYSWNHLMPGHSKELGYGRLNCYKMVKTANDMQVPGVDLYIRDLEDDFGIEPNEAETGTPMWISPDIWIRNQDDGTVNQVHENPEYSATNPVYVYIRVTNKGDETSTGNEELHLYWAKAGTDLFWEDYWIGNVSVNGIPMGGILGDQNVPIINAGEETILKFTWPIPDPEDYQGINDEPWHFCLLARIVATNDPKTFPEGPSVNENTFNNNNIAWKNVTIVDPLKAGRRPGGVISIGNTSFEEATTFELEFEVPKPCYGTSILDEAEVRITLDELSYNIWSNGGKQGQNIEEISGLTLLVTGDNAKLENLTFEPGQWSTIYVHFNFLTQYATTEKTVFEYMVTQRRSSDQFITGGELYIIHKPARPLFQADAGTDQTVSKDETVILSAQTIGEDAEYNWYNNTDSLIHSGISFWVTPDTAQKYRLEVIALADGYKDYDEVTVNVKQYEITGIAPNPTTGMVTVNYDATGATSSYLIITKPYDPATDIITLDPTQTQVTLNLSGNAAGVYGVILICNDQFADHKLILLQ